MIKPVNDDYSDIFASIYNSANTLFSPKDRCEAGKEVFYRQLKEDNNYIFLKGDIVCGFISYHKSMGFYEITSLYVKRDCQRMEIGHRLLSFVENLIEKNSYIIIKVLKNAFWAYEFYQKHGYKKLDETNQLMNNLKVTEKAWEKILYKYL